MMFVTTHFLLYFSLLKTINHVVDKKLAKRSCHNKRRNITNEVQEKFKRNKCMYLF